MLHKVIQQLNPTVYGKLKEDFINNRGEKLLQLMELYRNTDSAKEITHKQLDINTTSFYTLKSRLQDKVQRALFESASDVYADLLKNLASIPYLVSNSPRETTLLLLEFLAEELRKADQPMELAQVYAAMKAMNSWSQEFYHYEQLYNKSIAYGLAIEKAQEVLTHFARECSIYRIAHKAPVDVLKLYIKELNNISRMYESPRIRMYRYIAELTYALFVDENREIPNSSLTVEETLDKLREILDTYKEDRNFRYKQDIWASLSFEYYTSLGLKKNASAYFDEIASNEFKLLLQGHRTVTSYILISGFDRIIADKTLCENVLRWLPEPDPSNVYLRYNITRFKAGIAFVNGNYAEASSLLQDFLNDVSLKNFFVAEYHIKLFHVLSLLCAGKSEQAEIQLRSISRKIAAVEDKDSLQSGTLEFLQLFKVIMSNKGGDRAARIREAANAVNAARKNRMSVLPHIPLTEQVVAGLIKLL